MSSAGVLLGRCITVSSGGNANYCNYVYDWNL